MEVLADVLFYDVFSQMHISLERMSRMDTPLVGFTKDAVSVEGVITLPVRAGQSPRWSKIQVNFLVVRASSAYNAIFRCSRLNALQAIVSTYLLNMKFPTRSRVGEVCGIKPWRGSVTTSRFEDQGHPKLIRLTGWTPRIIYSRKGENQ